VLPRPSACPTSCSCTLLWMERFGERPMSRPAFVQPVANLIGGQPCSLGPLDEGQRLPLPRQSGGGASSSAVARLLQLGRPAAIVWRIWAIVVATLQRMLRGGARPQISEEIGERFPPITDRDPSASPAGISVALGIRAALFHSQPSVVFGCVASPMFVMHGPNPSTSGYGIGV
jgi:hypothetical protein